MWFRDNDGNLFDLDKLVIIESYLDNKAKGWTPNDLTKVGGIAINASVEEIGKFMEYVLDNAK